MGLLRTHWEAEHEGHRVAVRRNEVGRGFAMEWDGQEIARKPWSLFGLGMLQGTAELNGKPVVVDIAIRRGGWVQTRDGAGCKESARVISRRWAGAHPARRFLVLDFHP